MLEELLPAPLVKTNQPSFARVFVTEQPGRRIVHVLSYMPELRGKKTQIIEEPLQINDVAIALRCDGMKPVHARLEPEGKELGKRSQVQGSGLNVSV